jgi:GNAT superfamily N-acetyltransferase
MENAMKTQPMIDRPSNAPDVPRWTETLRDRSEVLIRPIQPQDRAAEARFIEGLSLQARRYRFLGQVASPSEGLVERFTDVDFVHDVAFVAVIHEDSHERIVGVARYSLGADETRCECAVTVAEDWQDKGLGTILMRHLIDVARARGIRTMFSIDAVENTDMRELAAHLGFRTKLDPKDPTLYIHQLELQSPETPPL